MRTAQAQSRAEGKQRDSGGGGSTLTVVVALAANASIAVMKAVAGLLTGSAAMLAEAAHSVADTTTEGLLLAALRQSERPADRQHPFGYGKVRFFWSLIAAVSIFVTGALFSGFEGVRTILGSGEDQTLAWVAFLVSRGDQGGWLRLLVRQQRLARRVVQLRRAESLRRERGRRFGLTAHARYFGLFVFVIRIAGRAPRLLHVVANHRDHDVVGEPALARAIVVQNVTKPRLALLHQSSRTVPKRNPRKERKCEGETMVTLPGRAAQPGANVLEGGGNGSWRG